MARKPRSSSFARNAVQKGVPLASGLLAAVSTALAQQAPPADTGGLEEIIVTAQKRSEDIQSVPMRRRSGR